MKKNSRPGADGVEAVKTTLSFIINHWPVLNSPYLINYENSLFVSDEI
jgi:hypothetical protein